MSFLDALSILGGGVGKGYRANQELQRQIGEAKRKALLEEREQIVKEQAARSQMALESSQAALNAQTSALTQGKVEEARKAALESDMPVVANSPTLNFDAAGIHFALPNKMGFLEKAPISNIIQQEIQGRATQGAATTRAGASKYSADTRVSNFQKATGTPAQRKAKYITAAMQGLPPWADEELANQLIKAKLAIARENDKEAWGDTTSVKNPNEGITKSGLKYKVIK